MSLSVSSLMSSVVSGVNTIGKLITLKRLMIGATILTTMYDVYNTINLVLPGEATIGDVMNSLLLGVGTGILINGVCGTAIGMILKPIMAAFGLTMQFTELMEAIKSGDPTAITMQALRMATVIYALATGCFTEDTEVETEEGQKPISEIKEGDYVWAENTETGERELKKVLKVYVKESKTLIHVFTGEEEIQATPNHPFYVEGKGWRAAEEVEKGDLLVNISGEFVRVDKVEKEELEEEVKVYNLEVEDFHTYYVSEEKVLVHNKYGEKESNSDEENTSDQGIENPVPVEGRGNTGRTTPNNLKEQIAMYQVQSDPLNGAVDMSKLSKPIIMTDPRWLATEGWVKMSNNVNGIEIHFVYNTITKAFDDFKFK